MSGPREPNCLTVRRQAGETDGETLAPSILEPVTRHAYATGGFARQMLDEAVPSATGNDYIGALQSLAEQAEAGDLKFANRMLVGQAMTLDAIFVNYARPALANSANPDACERLSQLAFKAAGGSRAALEALARLHQPREQTVRHVHGSEGGQAIVADQVNHAGGAGHAETVKQSHAAGSHGQYAAMRCPDPAGDPVPVSGGPGPEAMQIARRHKSRRA